MPTPSSAPQTRAIKRLSALARCLSGWRPWVITAVTVLLLMPLLLLHSSSLAAEEAPRAPASIILQEATLSSLNGQQPVTLPHVLSVNDFEPQGSRVRYRLQLKLDQKPQSPLGVYIPKVSLAGSLSVNGRYAASCGIGPLEDLRCLHRPQLLVVPAEFWQTGVNTLDFDVYATSRQMNGLSQVTVGDPAVLADSGYRFLLWLKVDLLVGLAWLSLLSGVLSLIVALILRREPVYFWFGLTGITNACALCNGFVERPIMPIDVYNWFVFSARLISAPMLFATFLALFGKNRRWFSNLVGIFCVVAPIVIWFSDNNRSLVIALYAPWFITGVVLIVAMLRWAVKAKQPILWGCALALPMIIFTAAIDWMRLGGQTRFEGVFLLAYASTAFLIIVWGSIVIGLVRAINQERSQRALLETRLLEKAAYELTENIPVGTYTLLQAADSADSVNIHFTFMSRRFLELIGLTRDQMLRGPERFFQIIHPDDLEGWMVEDRKAVATRSPFLARARIIVNGQTRWVVAESIPRQMPDGATVWEGVLIDETERVLASQAANQAQQELQQNLIDQSRAEERVRLLQDMHDGFGSQLAGLSLMAERGRVQPTDLPQYLNELMSDLYLLVDTLGHGDITFEEAIIDMRYRMQTRFKGSFPHLDWHIELTGLPKLGQRAVLHILRLIQEAVNNALKHANATTIGIRINFQPDTGILHVCVRDNGQGLPEALVHGRGLYNMHQRAREVGAELKITSSNGVEVCVHIDTAHIPA